MKKRTKQRVNKIITLNLIASLSFASFFSFPINPNAEETYEGRITTNDVRLRSKPTTAKENGVSNILTEVDENTIVTVVSTEKISGSGCATGWYNVRYQNYNGYICSDYISINGYDQYDRPWTSPKKAIVGGAKFIAKSYIARGQFTSYLKKFNVNPNSYYDMFNHQYMANLAAPSSEAKTSWSTYAQNGLADLPLTFSIPVFNEMAESYDRPNGNLINVEKQEEVTDPEFENALNAQGFPESYKKALRALHEKHKNWTFTAIATNVSFWEAMANEKFVSSIQGDAAYYQPLTEGECTNFGGTYKNGYCQTESGWYLANDATVSYYLDPRNFLTENYILQFESLENSDNYTEAIVQSILNGTFMSDLSVLDNQMYASIFVEAGKTANISAVYLASLAIQESGRNLASNTSGAAFDYEGFQYSGLYNFFNIGASSSASNPSKAGLVYASGGFCTLCSADITYDTSTVAPTPSVQSLANYISSAGFQISNNYVNGFFVGQSVAEVKSKLQNDAIVINASSELIGTGATISYNGETYRVIVYGDLTGDGKINSADLLKMRQHLQGISTLENEYFKAGAIVNGSSINSADLLKLRQHLLGTTTIAQI